MPQTTSAGRRARRGRRSMISRQATAGMREATRAVARCQPFCVYCATIDGRKDRSLGLALQSVMETTQFVHNHACAVSLLESFDEVPQLHSRKFPEAFLDLALGPLENGPARS